MGGERDLRKKDVFGKMVGGERDLRKKDVCGKMVAVFVCLTFCFAQTDLDGHKRRGRKGNS